MTYPLNASQQTRTFQTIRRDHLRSDYDDLCDAVHAARMKIRDAYNVLAAQTGGDVKALQAAHDFLEDALQDIAGGELNRIRRAFDDHDGDSSLMPWPAGDAS